MKEEEEEEEEEEDDNKGAKLRDFWETTSAAAAAADVVGISAADADIVNDSADARRPAWKVTPLCLIWSLF